MRVLFADTETFSEVPIKNGAYRYAEEAEVLLFPFAWDDEPVQVWDMTTGEHTLADIKCLIDEADVTCWHNSAFDRTVLRHRGVHIPVEKIEDTMVTALLHAFPGSLDKLCGALRLPIDKAKDKDGKRLIQLFTKPRPKNQKLRRATKETHPDDWQKFIEYAARDVDAMRSVRRVLPAWNTSDAEIALWRLDQRVNDRGVAVDLELADAAGRAFARASRSLAARAARLTGGAVASLTQRDKFLAYLRSRGVDPADLTKATVTNMVEQDLPADILELLEIRQQAASTTPAKYGALRDAASSDGRLRGCIQFSGAARTRRDAGRIFQPQNLIRTPDWFDEHVQEITIAALKADCEDIIYENVSERCAFVVRGSLVAGEGKKFLIADLSNIEGRGLAWLAGEEWKIEAFKAYDRGEGPDLYKVTAGRILAKPPVDVTKDERQTQGKVPELAGGYGGGLGAYRTMGGKVFDAKSDDEIMEIVYAWRKAHPATKRFWYDVEGAVRCAIKAADEGKLGESFDVRGLLRIDTANGPDGVRYVRIRLPSGAYLVYRDMVIEDNGQLTYEGLNQYTRKWERLETYYGKLCLAEGTLVLTERGWTPIELVTLTDRVWDGISWVSHSGLARKGVKRVISLNGVKMTPDHEVLTTKGWVRASQSEGLERADPRIPHGQELGRQRREELAVVADLYLRAAGNATGERGNQAAEAEGAGLLRLHEAPHYRGEETYARHVETPCIRGLEKHARPLSTANTSRVAALRRAWNRGVRAVAEVLRGFLVGYGAYLPRWAYVGAGRQFAGLFAGELPVGDTGSTGAQLAGECRDRHAVGCCHGSGSGGSRWAEQDDGVLPDSGRLAVEPLVGSTGSLAPVYDLMDCGPRNRFVVAASDGRAMIVHNCENIVQSVSRDVFMSGLRRAELDDLCVVLRVHDELVCEVPDDPAYTVERLVACMATVPGWAAGLPLKAEGFECKRYRK